MPTRETIAITAPSIVSTVRVSQQRISVMQTGTKVQGASATTHPSMRSTMYRIASSFILFTNVML